MTAWTMYDNIANGLLAMHGVEIGAIGGTKEEMEPGYATRYISNEASQDLKDLFKEAIENASIVFPRVAGFDA